MIKRQKFDGSSSLPESVLQEFLQTHLASAARTTEAKRLRVPTALLIAVSGGADSMALLEAAQVVAEQLRLRIQAAHLIHHPQLQEALQRAELVAQFCARRGIPLRTDRAVERPTKRLSPEEIMRQQRYRFLQEVATESNCGWILTGHQADDQAETVLLRILQGTGLAGLEGIRERRDNVLRPFLTLSHATLRVYCQEKGVPFADDPLNWDLQRPRNVLRHELLPLLQRRINPQAPEALRRLSRWATEANEVISSETAAGYEKALLNFQKGKIILDISMIFQYFVLLQKNVVCRAMALASESDFQMSSLDGDQVLNFLRNSQTGSILRFKRGVRLLRHGDQLIVSAQAPKPIFHRTLTIGVDLELPEIGRRVCWSRPEEAHLQAGHGDVADLTLGGVTAELVLRYARPGDHFFPLGALGSKRLFRFLTDQKVAREDKSETLVLERAGEIIWVVGHRVAQSVRITPTITNRWRISLPRINDQQDNLP